MPPRAFSFVRALADAVGSAGRKPRLKGKSGNPVVGIDNADDDEEFCESVHHRFVSSSMRVREERNLLCSPH